MLKKVCVWVVALGLMSGCINKDEIYANPPRELLDQIELLLPAAEQFVTLNEAEALGSGLALNQEQLIVAAKIGVQAPNKVRLYYVDALPFPQDPALASLAKKYGYSSPNMAAYTYGYGVWIKRTARGDKELLAHELIHVRQAEQMGIKEQTKQYLIQLFIYGYNGAPMELEAYREAPRYL